MGHSGSFKVILVGVGRNTERGVVVMHNNVNLSFETYEDMATGKLQIGRFQPPRSALTTVLLLGFRISANNLYCENLESFINIFTIVTIDSMGICLLLFTQLFWQEERSKSKRAGTKT